MPQFDIDIDLADRNKITKLIKHVPACLRGIDQIKKHNSGIYVTEIPYDPINLCSAIDYNEAEDRGYFKIDLLNLSVYKLIQSYEHYDRMLTTPVPWERLKDRQFCEQIVHIGNHYDTLIRMPELVDSIPRMAAFISIIRPGKAHLIGKSWKEVFDSVWDGDSSRGYTFKKSHAISYSCLVSLHINLLTSGIT
jgi:hypothetical protein